MFRAGPAGSLVTGYVDGHAGKGAGGAAGVGKDPKGKGANSGLQIGPDGKEEVFAGEYLKKHGGKKICASWLSSYQRPRP